MDPRTEYILKAKLYESTEKFDLMFEEINKFVELNPELSKEERIILNNGYKNIITGQRRTWRDLVKTETKERDSGNQVTSDWAKELRLEVESEILEASGKVLEIVNQYLIPNAKTDESKLFFLKMKADFLRYQAEINQGDEYVALYNMSMQTYIEGMTLGEKLPVWNTVRLGNALNYSVLMYEVVLKKEPAINIAKTAYDEVMKIIDDIEKDKELILLIQLLKENISLWNNDNEEDNAI